MKKFLRHKNDRANMHGRSSLIFLHLLQYRRNVFFSYSLRRIKIHILVLYPLGIVLLLIYEIHYYRNRNYRVACNKIKPVEFYEYPVVRSQTHYYTYDDNKPCAERIKRRFIIQLVEAVTLLHPSPSESVMSHAYRQPVIYTGDTAEVICRSICHSISYERSKERRSRNTCSYQNSSYRNAVAADLSEKFRSVSPFSHML